MPWIENLDMDRFIEARQNTPDHAPLVAQQQWAADSAETAQTSLAGIWQAEYDRLVGTARTIVRSRAVAEDCVSTAYVEIALAWQRLKSADQARGWMYAAVRNNALDVVRQASVPGSESTSRYAPLTAMDNETTQAHWSNQADPVREHSASLVKWLLDDVCGKDRIARAVVEGYLAVAEAQPNDVTQATVAAWITAQPGQRSPVGQPAVADAVRRIRMAISGRRNARRADKATRYADGKRSAGLTQLWAVIWQMNPEEAERASIAWDWQAYMRDVVALMERVQPSPTPLALLPASDPADSAASAIMAGDAQAAACYLLALARSEA